MGYCTLEDLKGIAPESDLVELTDDAGTGEIDEAKIDQAIADASELMDGYLRGRYALPLANASRLVVTLARDIALYRLYGRRYKLTPPETVKSNYGNSLKILEQIQQNKISLGPSSTEAVSHQAPDRVFSRDSMKGF